MTATLSNIPSRLLFSELHSSNMFSGTRPVQTTLSQKINNPTFRQRHMSSHGQLPTQGASNLYDTLRLCRKVQQDALRTERREQAKMRRRNIDFDAPRHPYRASVDLKMQPGVQVFQQRGHFSPTSAAFRIFNQRARLAQERSLKDEAAANTLH